MALVTVAGHSSRGGPAAAAAACALGDRVAPTVWRDAASRPSSVGAPLTLVTVMKIPLALSLVAAAAAATAVVPPPAVPYPEGYREWVHVKSALIGPGPAHAAFGGLHHVYANAAALAGYRAGRFPDGAVLVLDRLDVIASGN